MELTLDIIGGCRPKIHEYIPHEYVTLMKQCWDANPDNRPDAKTIWRSIKPLIKSLYNEMDKKQELTIQPKLKSKSKIKNFLKFKSTKNKDKQVIKNTQNTQSIEKTKSKVDRIQNSKVYNFSIPI